MKKRYLFAGISGVAAGALATKLLTRPRDVSWPESIDLIYHPENSWFTSVDGVRLHYQEAGKEDSPPLILIHGFISSSLVWKDVLLPLAAAGFRVIAPDLPGYGYSDKPTDGEYSIAAQAQAVRGLMDRLGIARAAILGASYGGAIAATLALDCPERVERLVLVSPVTNDAAKDKPQMRVARIPLLGDIVTPLFLGSRWILRKRMEGAFRRLGIAFDEHMFAARHHLLKTANVHRAMLRSIRNWTANRIARDAHLIRQPAMIMWGDVDTHIPAAEGYRLRDAMPNSRLLIFRNCGHSPNLEYPEKFVEAVSGFCRVPGALDSKSNTLDLSSRKARKNRN